MPPGRCEDIRIIGQGREDTKRGRATGSAVMGPLHNAGLLLTSELARLRAQLQSTGDN